MFTRVNFSKENGMVGVKFYFQMRQYNRASGYKIKNNDGSKHICQKIKNEIDMIEFI